MRLVRVLSREIPFASTREACIGNLQHLQQGRDLCLARITPKSLGDVEADIRFFVAERVRQVRIRLDKDRLVPIRLQRGSDRVDGLDMVKIGKGIRWDPFGFGQASSLIFARTATFQYRFRRRPGGLSSPRESMFLSLGEVNFVASIRHIVPLARFGM